MPLKAFTHKELTMKRHLTGVACVLGVLLMAACAAPSAPLGPTDDEMIAAANALDDQFIAAFNSGDAAALAALYTMDAVSFPPDMMEARGQMAIQVASQASAEAMAGAKLELTDQRNVVVGDAVVGYGLWRMTMPVPDGPPMMREGRYTDVKVMRDGKWLYMVDHASAPLPPPPAG
jgi:uncharacterized protein (TIGR02246 family)